MATLKTILAVIFVIICIVLTIIVLMQEGKSAGLGAISGAAETYWGKNKGRSMEGALEKATRLLVIGFIVIAIVLIPVSSKAKGSSATTTDTTTTDTLTNDTMNNTSIDATDVSGEAADMTDDVSDAAAE